MMTEALRFVKGAVATKDYQPALTHFRIKDGTVAGYNGIIALSSPIDLEITATPKATQFIRAIEGCKHNTTTVHLTPGGKLALRSGGFRAYVPCTDDTEVLDAIQPEGEDVEIAGEILPALKKLAPYIGTDASRPWATGILFRGHSAYATNNIVVAEYWIGQPMPEVNLPAAAIKELLRIKEEPVAVKMSSRSMTFFFDDHKWMRTQLLGADWPDLEPILNAPGEPAPVPQGFFEAIETLVPFVGEEGRIFFREGVLATSQQEGEGASIEFEGLPDHGAFHYQHLMSLQDNMTEIDFSRHPQLCPFLGERMRGVILGMVDDV